jgi:hypothetical protein
MHWWRRHADRCLEAQILRLNQGFPAYFAYLCILLRQSVDRIADSLILTMRVE